jgi:hypothetical protein
MLPLLGMFTSLIGVPSAEAESGFCDNFAGTYVPGYLYSAAARLEHCGFFRRC